MNTAFTAISKKRKPKIITWPITRERYRQVLMKMHRQWEEIQNLLLENESLKAEIERMRK